MGSGVKIPTLTVTQVAELLQKNPETIYRWIGANKLKATKVGFKEWRIAEEDLAAFIKGDKG